MLHSRVVTGRWEWLGKLSQFSIRPLIDTIFRANYCPTWHYQVWYVLSFSNISLPVPVLLKFDMSSWNTLYLRFKNFKGPIWHGLLNVTHQILLSIFDFCSIFDFYIQLTIWFLFIQLTLIFDFYSIWFLSIFDFLLSNIFNSFTFCS